MYEKAFTLEIITPTKIVYKGEATSLSAPGVKGGFQVLYNHAPLLSALTVGEIKVKDTLGKDTKYATSGGFVEVEDNHVVVLADTAEITTEIDLDRAKAAEERARERLRAKNDHVNDERARAALARALNRVRIATHV